jgi:hypothetical protein
MSLAISVGLACGPDDDPEAVAYHRKSLRQINRLLAAHGLPPHTEPENVPPFPFRGQPISFPYAWTPYFMRAVAFARRAPDQFTPVRDGEDPSQHRHLDAELYTFAESHLICHSWTEGYYVPIDFADWLCDNRKGGLPGRILGSSQRGLRELVQTAPLLGIRLDGQELSDQAALAVAKEPDESHPCWVERKVWLSYFEAFRLSVEHKCAVVFS